MNFTVYTDANGASDRYDGTAECYRDGAILIVEDGERYVLYGPNGWIRVEADEEIVSEKVVVELERPVEVEGSGGGLAIPVVLPDGVSVSTY
jgi:hypothetical protein